MVNRVGLGICIAWLLATVAAAQEAPTSVEDAAARRAEAEDALSRGDAARAAEILSALAVAFPDDALVAARLGEAYSRLGRSTDAADSFRRAFALSGDLVRAYARVGLDLALSGRADDAVAFLRGPRAAVPPPVNDPAWTPLLRAWGVALRGVGRLPEALAELTRAVELAPADAETCIDLGNLQLQLGIADAARQTFLEAQRLDASSAQAANGLGRALVALDQVEPAVAAYRRAVELQPQYLAPRNNLGLALQRLGRTVEAADIFREVVALDSTYLRGWLNLGNALLDLERWPDAELSLRLALELDPNVAETHEGLGRALFGRDDPAAALDEFDRALALEPDRPRALLGAGEALVALDRPADAVARFTGAKADPAVGADALLQLGETLVQLGRLEEAEGVCLEVTVRLPQDARTYLFIGHALVAARLPERAVDAFKKALALAPTDPQVAMQLARALGEARSPDAAGAFMLAGRRYLALRRFPEAVRAFRLTALPFAEAHAGLGEALFGTGELNEAISELAAALESFDDSTPPERVAEVRALRAVALARAGQSTLAVEEAEIAGRAAPRSVRVQAMRGDVLMAAGHAAEAVDAYAAAVVSDAGDPQGVLGLCRARVVLAPADAEAERACREAADRYPSSAEMQRMWGRTLEAAGRTDEAVAAYFAALTVAPRDVETNHLLGNLLVAQGKFGAALERFAVATELAPDDTDLLVDRVAALQAAGRLDEALELAEKAVAAAPTSRRARAARGWLQLDLGWFDRGEEAFRALNAEDAADPEALHGLGMALFHGGRSAEGIPYLERAAARSPQDPDVLFHLGVARIAAGKGAEAVEPLVEARRLAPLEPSIAYYLAQAYGVAGRWVEADRSLNAAFDLDPQLADDMGFEELRQRINANLPAETPAPIP